MRPLSTLALATATGLAITLTGCTTTSSTTLTGTPFAVIDHEKSPVPNIRMGDRKTIAAIINESKNNSQVMDHLSVLTETYGPRLTGSTNLENSQRWARDQFESWGLDNAEMAQWGVIETRFDRGPSTGKVFLNDKEIREMQFSTLSWTRGTQGPESGPAIHMPETLEEYEARKGEFADAWVLLKPNFTKRGDARFVGGNMRKRMDERHNIREEIAVTKNEPVHATEPVDSNAWSGSFDYHGSLIPTTLTIDETTDPVTGNMGVAGFSEGAISKFVRDGNTVRFHWKHDMGSSDIELVFDGDKATGVSKSSSGNEFNLAFARGGAPVPSTDGTDSEASQAVLAAVLSENPHGFISSSMDERVWTTSANNWRSRAVADYPVDIEVNVRQSDYDFLSARAHEGTGVVVEFDLPHTLTAGPIPNYNVIAQITGSEKPEEVIIISAHIDSWDGPGSMGTTDNATGVAVTMEAARILTSIGAKPKRTIIFALWGGEEQGLLGSKGYMKTLTKDEQIQISATFVDDGGTNYQGGIPAADFMVSYLAAATAPTNGQFFSEVDGKFLNVNIRPTGDKIKTHSGSDHAPFNQAGIPGFFWDETGRADYQHTWHTQNDTIDYAIEEYLVQSAANAAVVAYNLANAPGLLPRAPQGDE